MEALNKKRRTLKLVTGDSDSGKWWGSRGQIFEQGCTMFYVAWVLSRLFLSGIQVSLLFVLVIFLLIHFFLNGPEGHFFRILMSLLIEG